MVAEALIALAGLLVGFFLGRRRDAEKLNTDTRSHVYIEYMAAQSALTRPYMKQVLEKHIRGVDMTPDEWAAYTAVNEQFANAHAKMMIYGSETVLTALSEFYDYPENIGSPEGREAYAKLVAAMRKDTHSKNYDGFGEHLDNVMLSGVDRRRAQLLEKFNSGEIQSL